MKLIVFLVVAGFALETVHADAKSEAVNILKNLFDITADQAESCILKNQVTLEDLQYFFLGTMIDSEDSNRDDKRFRKGSCTLACCVNALGAMSEGQINVPVLESIINESQLPETYKKRFSKAAKVCADQVKEITDECDVNTAFMRCMQKKNLNKQNE
ncbi:uncharacterized protein LOC143181563 [Calliopsis andreniformis]|uniref:uncharacterized protein LOC143181563 n=1 Tax=Calliopsis andreniformis TaxID=337506 RepID=UPI003FCC4D64